MADRADITPELCRQLLHCDPATGQLFWKSRPQHMFADDRSCRSWNTKWAGKETFTTLKTVKREGSRSYDPCYVGSIFDLKFKKHRVIWAIVHGIWPEIVDHKNGDPLDNRIDNLRSVSQRENKKNTRIYANNKSGRIGVHWTSKVGRWTAAIKINGRKKHLGDFDELSDAIAARDDAERLYGFHENHGRKVV